MKTKVLFLVCYAVVGLLHTLSAQTTKCDNYACMIQKAKEYFTNGQYEDAVNSATAAKRYSNAKEAEADALIKEIFRKMNQLQIQTDSAKTSAQKATLAAENSARVAKTEEKRAIKAEKEANQQRDSVLAARTQVEKLIQKGNTLESTFSDTKTSHYLYQVGLKYFRWDKIAQSRDYKNALTYFALARFLEPSPMLDRLVFAAQTGIGAEADFLNGQLDSAYSKYTLIMLKLDSTSQYADFEKLRKEQIVEVKDSFQVFSQKHNTQTTTATLEGNWWTLPSDFKQYQAISTLVFKNLPVTFQQFPTVLDTLPQLRSVFIIQCPEIRNLGNWERLSRLQTLTLQDNANLYSLDSLEKLGQLTSLNIDNCPALTYLKGCAKLDHFAISRSPQAQVDSLLQDNPGLKRLELADLPGDSLNSENLGVLESLSLSRMNVRNLQGLGKNTSLQTVKIDQMAQLKTFSPPNHLVTAYIGHCDSLNRLDGWPHSDQLDKLVLFENSQLRELPNWDSFPQLRRLLIKNNNDIKKIKYTKSLKNADGLYVLNNPNLSINSINAGFGFEWGVDPASVKLEYERRRTLPKFANQEFGLKFLVHYARKQFGNDALYDKKETRGFIAGSVITYYSPYIIFVGIGMGVGRTENLFSDRSPQRNTNFVWINTLGFQIAPWFLKKDKVDIGVDLYNIFEKDDYFILPSFGLLYRHTLGFHKKMRFIRPSDSKQPKFLKRHWDRIDLSPEGF